MPRNCSQNKFPIITYRGDATHVFLYKTLQYIKSFFKMGDSWPRHRETKTRWRARLRASAGLCVGLVDKENTGLGGGLNSVESL